MKYVAYAALVIIAFAGAVLAGIIIFAPPKPPPVVEPPCEELVWMRDLPQKRCIEYWNQRNLEENQ